MNAKRPEQYVRVDSDSSEKLALSDHSRIGGEKLDVIGGPRAALT
jgi:hypothetical protein